MSLGNCVQGDKEVLEESPATPSVDYVLVLREGGGVKLRPGVRLSLPQITLCEQTSSCERWRRELNETGQMERGQEGKYGMEEEEAEAAGIKGWRKRTVKMEDRGRKKVM